jgi:hypothetical protein
VAVYRQDSCLWLMSLVFGLWRMAFVFGLLRSVLA